MHPAHLALSIQPAGASATASPALLALLASAPRVDATVCSPYAALSGCGDDFSSMDDLVRGLRLTDVSSNLQCRGRQGSASGWAYHPGCRSRQVESFSSQFSLLTSSSCASQVQVRSVRAGVLLDIASAPTVGMADRHGQVRQQGLDRAAWCLQESHPPVRASGVCTAFFCCHAQAPCDQPAAVHSSLP